MYRLLIKVFNSDVTHFVLKAAGVAWGKLSSRKDNNLLVIYGIRSSLLELLHGRPDKALANHFRDPGSILNTGCSESELDREIFAPVPEAALNGCELHVKPHFNFF